MTVVARKPVDAPLVCAVIARTREKMRLQAPRADLLEDPVAPFTVGSHVLVDATYDDGSETCLATVIGKPSAAVIEIETNGELMGKPKQVALRRTHL